MITNQQKEELRFAALEMLAIRAPAALQQSAILRRIAPELDFYFEPAELEGALSFLQDKGLVKFEVETLGSTKYWQATSAGVLHIERGGA